jgi:Serine acetyltransferase
LSYDETFIKHEELIQVLMEEIHNILDSNIPPETYETSGLTAPDIHRIYESSLDDCLEDMITLINKDPTIEDITYKIILESSSAFRSVIYFRISNTIYYYSDIDSEKLKKNLATKISNEGKSKTQIEIHPGATIGQRFVIDHGINTVIGDSVIIGNDCYISHGVTVGSKNIINTSISRGHPVIGDNVQIGGFARIFGSINIGSNVCIGPCCVVTEDIPSNCNVLIVNQLQLVKNLEITESEKIRIYGIVPNNKYITIYGSNLESIEIELVDKDLNKLEKLNAKIYDRSKDYIKICFSAEKDFDFCSLKLNVGTISLKLKDMFNNICITKSIGLKTGLINYAGGMI